MGKRWDRGWPRVVDFNGQGEFFNFLKNVHVYVCAFANLCAFSSCNGSQKKTLDHLGLKLQVAGNQNMCWKTQ